MKHREIILSRIPILFTFLTALVFFTSCDKEEELETWEVEIERLKEALDGQTDFEMAKSMGYAVDVTGYRTGMGHHFLDTNLVDYTFDLERPEVMLFLPDEVGNMQFVAVEYGVVVDDINNPPPPPPGFSGEKDVWELSSEFSLWTLHVWIGMENERGIFAPMNPKIP